MQRHALGQRTEGAQAQIGNTGCRHNTEYCDKRKPPAFCKPAAKASLLRIWLAFHALIQQLRLRPHRRSLSLMCEATRKVPMSEGMLSKPQHGTIFTPFSAALSWYVSMSRATHGISPVPQKHLQ